MLCAANNLHIHKVQSWVVHDEQCASRRRVAIFCSLSQLLISVALFATSQCLLPLPPPPSPPSLCKKFLSPTAHSCSPLPLCAAAAASDAREGIATMWLTVHLRQPTLLNIHFRRQLPRQPWATPTYPVLSSPEATLLTVIPMLLLLIIFLTFDKRR